MRNTLHHRVKKRLHAFARLARDVKNILLLTADKIEQFSCSTRNVGVGKINLVEHRNDLEILIKRKIEICDRLRLHALRRVHEKDRSLDGRKRSRNFIIEIHVPGRINEVQRVALIAHPNGRELDRDPLLPFQIHRVEHLLLHLAFLHRPCHFKHPVG